MTLNDMQRGIYQVHMATAKEITPPNPEITFSSSKSKQDSNCAIETPNIDNFVAPAKPVGRPKNSKLSALAARRGVGKSKQANASPNDATATTTNKARDQRDTAQRSLIDNDSSDKQSGLSSSTKEALTQNLTHMACQVRVGSSVGSDLKVSDLIPLAQGVQFENVDSDEILRRHTEAPSRGMGMLFPGRCPTIRRLYITKSLVPRQLVMSRTDNVLINATKFDVASFDFDRSPINDIMMDLKREEEGNKRKKQGLKRLVKPVNPRKRIVKRKSITSDVSSIRKVLKKRIKEDNSIISRTVIIGPQRSGKSSLIGHATLLLDDDCLNKRSLTKLKWEAQKLGRPHDYLAWLVDDLDSERQFGRSRDVGEIFVELPSGKSCHIFDCPGEFDDLSKSADCISLADALILVVDVTSLDDGDNNEKRRILDLFRLINQKSVKSINLTVVLNKMDQCMWSNDVIVKAVRTVMSILNKVSHSERINLNFLPVSARQSDGIVALKQDVKVEDMLVNHATFQEVLDASSFATTVESEPQESDLQPVVAVVKDVYENMGAGFTAVLEIKEGVLYPSQILVCFPASSTAHVRTVQIHRGRKLIPVAAAVRGELVHSVLWHIDVSNVKRGSLLCDPILISGANGIHNKSHCMTSPIKTGLCWKAEVFVHDLNGLSIIPGRQVIFHTFSFTSHAYLRRLLWVRRKCSCKKSGVQISECDECVRTHPYVVSSPNVSIGVELRLEELHTCFLDRSINSEFTLYDGSFLFASGALVDIVTGSSERGDLAYDLRDRNSLHFKREKEEVEEMEVDIDEEDS